GFLHATSGAASMLVAGPYEHAMVIGAETLTRFVDPEDRTIAVLMGDGAGAAVLSKTLNPQQSILHAALGCDGSRAKHIWVPAGGSLLPASANTVAERLHYMKMRGRDVYKFAVVKMQQIIDEALKATNLTANDLKLVIPHQSNLRIIESVRQRMGLPEDKIAVNIVRYGNTSAASIPVALDEARHDGTLTEGDHVLMVAIGAGLTWATMVVRL
ncbi:MAG: 3-oxoacyl-ACP synthase, partial [Planctomycetes bacterium]|nr:3-oxoacyl-ACP synthase [Planctomycetota bacterium]